MISKTHISAQKPRGRQLKCAVAKVPFFETCPRLFYQNFTIHIIKYGQTFPMVYALLPNKQQTTYNRVANVKKINLRISNNLYHADEELTDNRTLKLHPEAYQARRQGGFEGVRSNPPSGPQKILYTLL